MEYIYLGYSVIVFTPWCDFSSYLMLWEFFFTLSFSSHQYLDYFIANNSNNYFLFSLKFNALFVKKGI